MTPADRRKIEGVGQPATAVAGLGGEATAPDTATYGQAVVSNLMDKIEDLLNDVRIGIAGYSNKFDYVHRRHNIAALRTNAVTFEITGGRLVNDEGAVAGAFGISAGFTDDMLEWDVSVRVHTAYEGDAYNSQEAALIVNSIANGFMQRQSLGDGFHLVGLQDIQVSVEHPGGTLGGALAITIQVPVQHEQQ